MDEVPRNFGQTMLSVGCPHLLDAINRVKPKIHVFGHIHEQHGIFKTKETVFVNAAQLDDSYLVAYKPKILHIDDKKQVTF
jgi:Icc-related predicted phosphoesterase